MIRFTIVAVALLALEACPPSPAPPSPDASDAAPSPQADASTPSVAACANMAAAGCPEGKVSNCAVTLDHVVAARLTRVDVACLTTKTTKAELRACGFVECK